MNNALMGEAWGPTLVRRLEREALAVLQKYGQRGGRVRVLREGAGIAVHVDIPRGPTRVERVVLRLG